MPVKSHRLQSHPGLPAQYVHAVTVEATAEPRALLLDYSLTGDLRHLRIPPQSGGGRAERLWQHTCFEVFVRIGAGPDYLELNFSPSGQWAAYEFDDYRSGMRPHEPADPPRIRVVPEPDNGAAAGAGGLRLEARVRLQGRWGAERPLHLGLSAVVEDDAGGLSYWALRHAPGRPDFHHPDGFALTLP